MKIGIVAPGGFDRSGTERVIPVFLWLVERLAREHEVHVFTLRQGPDEEQYPLLGATVHNIGDRGGRRRSAELMARTIAAIGREHNRGRFTVLHGLWAAASGLAAAIAGKCWLIPTVVSVAGGEMSSVPEIGYGSQLSLKSRMEVGLCLRLADVVTGASEWMCRSIRKHRPDVRHVVMGVDTEVFQPAFQEPIFQDMSSHTRPPSMISQRRLGLQRRGQDRRGSHIIRKGAPVRRPRWGAAPRSIRKRDETEAGVNQNHPAPNIEPSRAYRLLHVGSLNPVKDQATLLRAFLEIVIEEPSAHLDIIGIDTLNGEIQRLAHDLGLDGDVTFHGCLPSEDVASFVQKADLLLHTSLSEMGPIVCLEAAACGVPTVGTSVGLIADLAPEAAVAVPVGDHHALAQAAIALLRNIDARRAMGNRALEFAQAHDADWTALQFELIYADLVCRSGDKIIKACLPSSAPSPFSRAMERSQIYRLPLRETVRGYQGLNSPPTGRMRVHELEHEELATRSGILKG